VSAGPRPPPAAASGDGALRGCGEGAGEGLLLADTAGWGGARELLAVVVATGAGCGAGAVGVEEGGGGGGFSPPAVEGGVEEVLVEPGDAGPGVGGPGGGCTGPPAGGPKPPAEGAGPPTIGCGCC
jgi:hypothetical protein